MRAVNRGMPEGSIRLYPHNLVFTCAAFAGVTGAGVYLVLEGVLPKIAFALVAEHAASWYGDEHGLEGRVHHAGAGFKLGFFHERASSMTLKRSKSASYDRSRNSQHSAQAGLCSHCHESARCHAVPRCTSCTAVCKRAVSSFNSPGQAIVSAIIPQHNHKTHQQLCL